MKITIDLLTNFCEFKTTDKYGGRWSAAVKWGSITEDFNHIYQQDVYIKTNNKE